MTPNDPDPEGWTAHSRFWVYDRVQPITTAGEVKQLCRTLRNGFAHFNFRYIDLAPADYFSRMGLPLPVHLPQPDEARHYRIFICDWDKKKGNFMEPASDTRIIETHFAHFRYHLFMFLARLFSTPEREAYKDILKQQPIE